LGKNTVTVHNLFGEVHGVLYHAGLAIINRQSNF
jgi:hypothetical protein